MKNLKIAISGELGSGKTALGQLICKNTDFTLISIGSIQRELAEKYGMSTLEFNKYMESHPKIDIECDDTVIKHGKSNINLVLDSRMAWHFVSHAFKIHLIVNIDVAAARIFNDTVRKNENNNDLTETIENIKRRKNSEIKRFKEQYNVDIDKLTNYNIVIDTSYITPQNLANFVIDKFNIWKNNISFPRVWLSPKNIFPMQGIREHSRKNSTDIRNSIKENGFNDKYNIHVIYNEGYYFMFDGHKRCSSAIDLEIDLIPVYIINTENDRLPNGQPIYEYIRSNYDLKNIYDWEDMHKFRFTKYL